MQTMNRVGRRIASTRRVRSCGGALVRRAYATSPTTPTTASAATVTYGQRRGGDAGGAREEGAAREQREPKPQADPPEADPAPSFVDPSGLHGCPLGWADARDAAHLDGSPGGAVTVLARRGSAAARDAVLVRRREA